MNAIAATITLGGVLLVAGGMQTHRPYPLCHALA